MDPLDALATDLRERLLAAAGDDDGDLPGRIRALVDREAGVLSARNGAPTSWRGSRERAFGLGPLEPLLADPAVDEIMVSGTGAGVGRARAGGSSATGVRFEREADLRDAIERILAPLGRRADEAEPLVRRAPAGRLAGQRGAAAAGAGRPRADDPPLPPARLLARGPRRQRDADAAAARLPRARGAGARDDPRLRRHRLGQDDDAERAVELRRRRRADRDDRGRRRAAAAPAARDPARGAPAEPRGPRRGDDPPARPQRAADAAGPDHRRRGPRRRRRSTCSRRSRPATTARCAPSTPARPPRRCAGSRCSR